MEAVLKIFLYGTAWVLTPGILVSLLVVLANANNRAEDARHAVAAKSGFWAGIMLFVITLVYQVSVFVNNGFPKEPLYGGFDIWIALTGAIASLILFGSARKSLPPKMSGVFIMGITFLSLWALAHYLFIHSQNEFILSFVLGGTFGVLTHFAVSPATARDFLRF